MLTFKLKNSITASGNNTPFKSEGPNMAKLNKTEGLDFTDQNSKIIGLVDDDDHFLKHFGLINRRPLIRKVINANHISLIILDSILLNKFTYLPFIFGGTLQFDASITPTSTNAISPPVSESADLTQLLSVECLPYDENTGAPIKVFNSIANSSSDTQFKLQGPLLAELTEEDLYITDLPFIFGGTETLDASITRSCYSSNLPVCKLADPQALSMIHIPCDVNTGNPIVPIPIGSRNYGNGNGDNSRGSCSGNGGRNGGNAANYPFRNWFLPINIHKYEKNYVANSSDFYHRKIGLTIPTNIVPSLYHSWQSFAGAIYQFFITQIGINSPIITNFQVTPERGIVGVNPMECGPGFEPSFGVFADSIFYCFNYLYPWDTVKWLIRDVVLISFITRYLYAPF